MGEFLSTLLDKVQSHSTVIGKIWARALFIFRILILGTAAEIVWRDERSSFVCNTQQPGCENVCYDWFFPISQIRFWIVQVIVVTAPTLVYLCHVIHVVHQENKQRERIKQQDDSQMTDNPKYTDDQGHVKIKCNLLGSYLTQLFFKIVLELAFIVGQYYLYGFVMGPEVNCITNPCPHSTLCLMSRPTEKSIFNIFMLVVAGVSLLLNVIEVFYLLCNRTRCSSENRNMKNTTSAENWGLNSL